MHGVRSLGIPTLYFLSLALGVDLSLPPCSDFGFWVLGRAAALVLGFGPRSGPDSGFWAAQRRLNLLPA